MESSSFHWVRGLYALGWLSLAAFFALAFSAGDGISVPQAAVGALYYTITPALLGIAVIRLSLSLPWSREHRGRFFARHVGQALAFAAASAAVTVGAFRWLPPFEYEEGEMSFTAIFIGQFFLGTLIYCLLVGFTYATVGEIRRRKEAAAAVRAEALRAQAELKALRAQVNPHFLFNTLHSLLALVRSDPPAAEAALEQFGDLMRYALRFHREVSDEVSLGEEWAFTEDYLALEKLRLGSRLHVEASIPDAVRDHRVPAFSLQPLVENAVRHAIAPRASGGTVGVAASLVDGSLRLEVVDDGAGSGAEAAESSSGTGLHLLRSRLAGLYGDGAALSTEGGAGGFRVVVEIPAAPATAPEEGS